MATKTTATLSARYRLCVPHSIRKTRRWQHGQAFAFIPKGAGVLIVPVPKAHELAGMACGANPNNYRDRTGELDAARR